MKLAIFTMLWLISINCYGQTSNITIYYRAYSTTSNRSVVSSMNTNGKDFSSLFKNLPDKDDYFKLQVNGSQTVYAGQKSKGGTNESITPSNIKVYNAENYSLYFSDYAKDSIFAKKGAPPVPIFDEFYIKDNIPKIDWKIGSEQETIKGFHCNVAKAEFGGKELIAYFTLEIPIPVGPRYYGGLPGAILKLELVNINHVIVAENIYLEDNTSSSSTNGVFEYSIDNLPPEFADQEYITIQNYLEAKENELRRIQRNIGKRN